MNPLFLARLLSHMSIKKMAVLGAGQMGNGITQVAACAGYDVTMIDIEQAYVDRGLATIEKSLAKLVSKERMTQEDADAARGERRGSTEAEAAAFLFLSDTPGAFRDSFKPCSSRKKHLACI